jgi:NAD(P)-dependent dehydrogenase (short-subunit alcohol dehydrogenase family)
MNFKELAGRRVLITGSAGGIGFALAEAFHTGGAKVFLSDVDGERLAESSKKLGAPCATCDVRNTAAVDELFDEAWEALGSIDLLCSNAGVIRTGSLLEVSRAEIDFHFDVNVWGVLNTVRSFHRLLRAAGRGGHILMTGSEASLSNPSYVRGMGTHVYNMSKHSVLSMADVLRGELEAEGIGVSVLCPGAVSTRLSQHSEALQPAPAKTREPRARASIPEELLKMMMTRTRSPEEIAAVAIEGLRRGLFVIPTHPHIEEDVAERHGEIQRGLRALKEMSAGA